MNERQLKILRCIIEEYIRHMHPVSSGLIARRYQLGVSSATIRNELLELTEDGYLEQPHTSSGRVPTNRGWRFYVEEQVMDEPVPVVEVRKPRTFEMLAEEISRLTGMLGVSMREDGDVYLSGVSELFDQPDFNTKKEFRLLGETIDRLETETERIFRGLLSDAPNILIGKENAFFSNDDISTMFAEFETSDHAKGLAMVIGPKRMRYDRSWHILRNLERMLHQAILK